MSEVDWVARADTDTIDARIRRCSLQSFAASVLCTSIVHLADTGLTLCSTNQTIPDSCKSITSDPHLAKFCVGRSMYGLPLGVIVHAARDQADRKPGEVRYSPFSKAVFDHLLAVYLDEDGILRGSIYSRDDDPRAGAFPLTIELMMTLVEWGDYETYYADMVSMLRPKSV